MFPEWTPRVNVWLEVDGKVAFSRWRAELLMAVDRAGSISGAAKEMNIQYRLPGNASTRWKDGWASRWWNPESAAGGAAVRS